jgi:hypothetical protein
MKKLHLLLILFLTAALAGAQVPKTISYQGLLVNAAGLVPNGSYKATFTLYDASVAGVALWTETQTVSVLAGGVFNANLGAVTPLNLNFDKPYWLGIAINGSAEMMPRTAFTASPYSLMSLNTQKLQGRSVSTTAPVSGQVLKWNGSSWAPGSDDSGSGASGWGKTGDSLHYTAGSVTTGGGSFTVFGPKSTLPGAQKDGFWWISAKNAVRIGGSMGLYSSMIGNNSLSVGNGSYASGDYSVAMGWGNITYGYSAAAIGHDNYAKGFASLAVGSENDVFNKRATAVGFKNSVNADSAFAFGAMNQAKATNAIAIGNNVLVQGKHAVVIGNNMSSATFAGTMSLGDNSKYDIKPNKANQMVMRFFGGYYLLTGTTGGVILAPGGGSWMSMSDRRKKENFAQLDGEAVLAKLDRLPVSTWNYKSEAKTVRHAGPMAQDFYEAFRLGGLGNDTTITATDIDGVNLAAIKALSARTEQLRQTTEALQKQTATLTRLQGEYAELKALVQQLEARLNGGQPATALPVTTPSADENLTRSTR